ncbi:MAG: ribonuclease PH [Rickettsiales bacterium]|jgi:ribonuclease PH
MRPSKRKRSELREVKITTNVNNYAEGSCIVEFGNTKVLCTATVEEKVPPFLRGKKKGWLTAEYSMLPRSTHSRNMRDVNRNSPNGRALEIQRLIGRSLRAVVDLGLLGERQIIIDCDVLQADGGTRCASITGGYVALKIAVDKLLRNRVLNKSPIINQVCAVSCGMYKGMSVVDLDYAEDSDCDTDINFVLSAGKIIEVQGTAEQEPFSFDELKEMYELAELAAKKIEEIQNEAINV